MSRTGGLGDVVAPGKNWPEKAAPQGDDEWKPHPTKPGWHVDGKGRLRGPDMTWDAGMRSYTSRRAPDTPI